MKKTAVDKFNDNRQNETRRLDLKRRMDHDEKMASMHLKRRKYELKYGSVASTLKSMPTSGSENTTAVSSEKDKEIEILRLKIKLAELTKAHNLVSASQLWPSAGPLHSQGASTPASDPGLGPNHHNTSHAAGSSYHDAASSHVSGSADYMGGSCVADWDQGFSFTG